MSFISIVALFAVAFLGLVGTPKAYAYLDPGTGSLILQMLVAGFLGAAFGIKMFWQRILSFFRRTEK